MQQFHLIDAALPMHHEVPMDFAWNREQQDLFERVRNFAAARLPARTQFSEAWRRCGEFGLLGLSVPEAFGGMGLPALDTAGAVEAFGGGCEDMGLVFSACAHL